MFIANRMGIFTDPNEASIASAALGLKVGNSALGLHFFKKLLAPVRIDVDLSANARHRVNEVRRLSVAVKAREGRIRREVASVGRRLKNTFAGVFKDAPVFVFRRAAAASNSSARRAAARNSRADVASRRLMNVKMRTSRSRPTM